MDGHDNGALELVTLRLQARQLGGQERELVVRHREPSALGGDDAGLFEHVGVQPDDRDERRVEGEVNAGLGHDRAGDARGVGRGRWALGAEVTQKSLQRGRDGGCRAGAVDRPVVVSGDGEDRPVVAPKRFVELVVVVLILAEVVDHVAEVEEERWAPGRPATSAAMASATRASSASAVAVEWCALGGARVADRMEGDGARGWMPAIMSAGR